MKLLLLLVFVGVTLIFKYNHKDNKEDKDKKHIRGKDSEIPILINIKDFYTIHYTSYPNITKNIVLNEQENTIFDALKYGISNNYSIRVVGGWVRDKLTMIKANDIDLLITCKTEEELKSIIDNLFTYLNDTNVEKLTDPNYFKKPTPEDYRYGKTTFKIYGESIDVEIMSSKRQITIPYIFIPTDNFTLDAFSRDTTVNAMAYNIREGIIEDPLNGIEDLREGCIRPADPIVPLGKDFFRIMSILKTSAKCSIKISHVFKNFLDNTREYIKEYLLYYRTERTCHKFRKITDDEVNEYSIRAFNLLVDYDLSDVFVPIEYIPTFAYNQTDYKHKIFNLALVSEFMMKYAENPKFKITDKQKHYIYNEIFYLAFQKENELYFFYDTFKKTKFEINSENHKIILTTAKRYCEKIDCKKKKIEILNITILNEIIYDMLSNYKSNTE